MSSTNDVVPLSGLSPATHSSFASVHPIVTPAPRTLQSSAYSTDKFLALNKYTATTSPWRVAGVILVTPIPGLIGALLPALVPLQDPLLPGGVRSNPGYLVCGFMISAISAVGTMMHWRAGAEIPSRVFSNQRILVAAIVSVFPPYSLALLLIFMWRFPIPMSWILVSSLSGTGYALGFLAAFGKRRLQDSELVDRIKRYAPALTFQAIQILLYPAFSILFDHVTPIYQVLLTLTFPLVKFFMKKGLRSRTQELQDFNNEVAVTGIEICASLYQSMILQNAPSQVALIIIMAFDVLQGLVVVKFFMDRKSQIPQNEIVQQALKQLQSTQPTTSGAAECWVEGSHLARIPGHSVVPAPLVGSDNKGLDKNGLPQPFPANLRPPIGGRRASTTKPSNVVAHALQLVSVAESILLVEYLEVAIPLVNAAFVVVACQFNGAQYNTRLRRLYFHHDALSAAVQSIVFYSFLQALSFVAMHLVMRYRYGLSATYHLAFVLEHHWASIVGKMVGWLPIILHFTVIHFGTIQHPFRAWCAKLSARILFVGVDFSFRFDFAAMLRESP